MKWEGTKSLSLKNSQGNTKEGSEKGNERRKSYKTHKKQLEKNGNSNYFSVSKFHKCKWLNSPIKSHRFLNGLKTNKQTNPGYNYILSTRDSP